MSENEKETKSLSIRFPAPMLEQMKEIAKQHNRSLNGEILTALEEYIKRNSERQIVGSSKQTDATEKLQSSQQSV